MRLACRYLGTIARVQAMMWWQLILENGGVLCGKVSSWHLGTTALLGYSAPVSPPQSPCRGMRADGQKPWTTVSPAIQSLVYRESVKRYQAAVCLEWQKHVYRRYTGSLWEASEDLESSCLR